MDIENVAEQLSTPKADLSRRALVKAGWVVPVVFALGIPKRTMALTASGGDGGGASGGGGDAGGGGGDDRGDEAGGEEGGEG